jgi:hypothetical protein
MMAGGWGMGNQLLQARADAGAPGLVTGAIPLYEPGPDGGIYRLGQLEQMQQARYMMQQQQQYQMGTGQWASWGGFQMGLLGQIEQQKRHLANFQQIRGLRSDLFEQNIAGQQMGIAHAMERAQLQYRHGMQNIAMQEKFWQANTSFQRQQFGMQWDQMLQAREWGREDLAFSRQWAGLQHEWQMEDLDRNIRFATGRQKEQLIRQRQRAEETFSIQEGRRGTQEERQEEVWKKEEEMFALRRNHFEEIKALETEQFALRKQQLTESFNMQMRHLQEQQDQAGAVVEIQREIRKIQDQQNEEDMKYRLAEMEQKAEYYKKVVFPNQEKEMELQEKVAAAQAKYFQLQIDDMSKGGRLWTAWEDILDFIEFWLHKLGVTGTGQGGGGTPADPAQPADPNQPPSDITPDFHGFTIEDALTGRIQRHSTSVSIGNLTIQVPPGNYDEQTLARAIKQEFETAINDLANSQRLRGDSW